MNPAPRFTDHPIPLRRCPPCTADLAQPEPSHTRSGCAFSVMPVTLPDKARVLLKLVGAHEGIEDDGELISRLIVARADAIGIARLAELATTHNRERPKGREGMPSGALPLPRAPP